MVGEIDGDRSLNGSCASIEASSITQTPACAERYRPRARRTVWCGATVMDKVYRTPPVLADPEARDATRGPSRPRGRARAQRHGVAVQRVLLGADRGEHGAAVVARGRAARAQRQQARAELVQLAL